MCVRVYMGVHCLHLTLDITMKIVEVRNKLVQTTFIKLMYWFKLIIIYDIYLY